MYKTCSGSVRVSLCDAQKLSGKNDIQCEKNALIFPHVDDQKAIDTNISINYKVVELGTSNEREQRTTPEESKQMKERFHLRLYERKLLSHATYCSRIFGCSLCQD